MHIAIAADRVAQRPRPGAARPARSRPAQQEVAAILERLVERHLGVDARRRRPAAPLDPRAHAGRRPRRDPRRRTMRARGWIPRSRRRCARSSRPRPPSSSSTSRHEDFILRLALHVQNLQHRAREQAWSRNPLTKSLKSTYPMIFEVAVFIASGLQRAPRHPAAGRRDRLHRDARRRPARAQPAGRPAADRDDRLPRLLRAARAAALDRSTAPSARRSRSSASRRASTPTGPRSTPTSCSPRSTPPCRATGSCGSSRSSPTPTSSACRPPPAASAGRGASRGCARSSSATSCRSAFVRGLDADGGEEGVIRRLGSLLVARGRDRRGLRRAHDRARAAVVHRVHRRARRAARARA